MGWAFTRKNPRKASKTHLDYPQNEMVEDWVEKVIPGVEQEDISRCEGKDAKSSWALVRKNLRNAGRETSKACLESDDDTIITKLTLEKNEIAGGKEAQMSNMQAINAKRRWALMRENLRNAINTTAHSQLDIPENEVTGFGVMNTRRLGEEEAGENMSKDAALMKSKNQLDISEKKPVKAVVMEEEKEKKEFADAQINVSDMNIETTYTVTLRNPEIVQVKGNKDAIKEKSTVERDNSGKGKEEIPKEEEMVLEESAESQISSIAEKESLFNIFLKPSKLKKVKTGSTRSKPRPRISLPIQVLNNDENGTLSPLHRRSGFHQNNNSYYSSKRGTGDSASAPAKNTAWSSDCEKEERELIPNIKNHQMTPSTPQTHSNFPHRALNAPHLAPFPPSRSNSFVRDPSLLSSSTPPSTAPISEDSLSSSCPWKWSGPETDQRERWGSDARRGSGSSGGDTGGSEGNHSFIDLVNAAMMSERKASSECFFLTTPFPVSA